MIYFILVLSIAALVGAAEAAGAIPWIAALGAPPEAFAAGIALLALSSLLQRRLLPKRTKPAS